MPATNVRLIERRGNTLALRLTEFAPWLGAGAMLHFDAQYREQDAPFELELTGSETAIMVRYLLTVGGGGGTIANGSSCVGQIKNPAGAVVASQELNFTDPDDRHGTFEALASRDNGRLLMIAGSDGYSTDAEMIAKTFDSILFTYEDAGGLVHQEHQLLLQYASTEDCSKALGYYRILYAATLHDGTHQVSA